MTNLKFKRCYQPGSKYYVDFYIATIEETIFSVQKGRVNNMISLYLKRLFVVLSLGLLPAPLMVFGQDKIEMTTEIETRPGFFYFSPNYYSVAADKSGLKIKKEPVYQSKHPSYQKLVIGNDEKTRNIVVVIDEVEGKPARVYVDANNNGDLTDDGDPVWTNESETVLTKDVIIKATFISDGKVQELQLPYHLMRVKNEKQKSHNGGDVIIYNPRYGRSGTLTINGKQYLVSIITTGEGLYPAPDKQSILIDLNRDGKLDRSALSPELFYGTEPFNIDGETYRIANASPLGDKITIEVSPTKAIARHYIKANEPVPDFAFTTLDGTSKKISDFKGKFVMLDFWAT